MTGTILAAAAGALITVGLLGILAGLRPTPVQPATPTRAPGIPVLRRWGRLRPRTRGLLTVGTAAGLLLAVWTGWLLAVVLVPAVLVGVPVLLSAPPTAERIDRIEAMQEWTRSLAGVLGGGVGLEQAITATLRSTPDPIKPQVSALVARLRARWATEAALRAFADDLDDATGDLIVANLLLAARRRNRGLASVLAGLAESVADDVAARRRIEAGRAKPRGTARLVTLITVAVLGVLAFTGSYVQPYASPLGQVILAGLLAGYVAALAWLRRMARGTALPRFLGTHAAAREDTPTRLGG